MRKLTEENKETGLTILRNEPKKYFRPVSWNWKKRKQAETEFAIDSFSTPFFRLDSVSAHFSSTKIDFVYILGFCLPGSTSPSKPGARTRGNPNPYSTSERSSFSTPCITPTYFPTLSLDSLSTFSGVWGVGEESWFGYCTIYIHIMDCYLYKIKDENSEKNAINQGYLG